MRPLGGGRALQSLLDQIHQPGDVNRIHAWRGSAHRADAGFRRSLGRQERAEGYLRRALEANPLLAGADRELTLDTRAWELGPRHRTFRAGDAFPLMGRSLAVFRLRRRRFRLGRPSGVSWNKDGAA